MWQQCSSGGPIQLPAGRYLSKLRSCPVRAIRTSAASSVGTGIPKADPAQLKFEGGPCPQLGENAAIFTRLAVQQLGHVFTFDMGAQLAYGLAGQTGICSFYDPQNVVRGPLALPQKKLLDTVWSFQGKHAVTALDGPQFLNRKRLMLDTVTSMESAARYLEALDGTISTQLQQLGADGKPFSMHAAIQSIALGGLSEAIYGYSLKDYEQDCGTSASEVIGAMREMFSVYTAPEATRRHREARDCMFSYVQAVLHKHKTGDDKCRASGLAQLLKDQRAGQLDDAEVLCDAYKVLGDGPYGMSCVVSMMVHSLCKNPAVRQRVRGEVKDLPNAAVKLQDLKNLPYTFAVVKEVLRWWPAAAAIPGLLIRDLEIEGHHIPANSIVFGCIHATLRDPQRFPNPDMFDPGRWLDAPQDDQADWEAYMLAFGGPDSSSSHACGGKHVALAFLLGFAARLCQAWSWDMVDPTEGFRDDLISPVPTNGLMMRVE